MDIEIIEFSGLTKGSTRGSYELSSHPSIHPPIYSLIHSSVNLSVTAFSWDWVIDIFRFLENGEAHLFRKILFLC